MATNTVSIASNIEKFTKNIEVLTTQKAQIEREILKMEGALMVLTSFKDIGVDEIPFTNPLETKEVIDNKEDAPVSD
jgi:hypothetical protein